MRRRAFLGAGLLLPAASALARTRQRATAGKLLIVDSVGSSLVVLETQTMTRVGRIPLERRPREIAVSPDGSIAYVGIYGLGMYGNNPSPGRQIVAIDTRTLKVTRRISIAPHQGPHGLAVAPDGRLWVTCETEGSLLVVDPAARPRAKGMVSEVPLGVKGPYWIAISPDGSKVYATSKDNPVLSVVDAVDGRLIQEIKTPGGLEGLAIAPDGRRLYAAAISRPSLWIIDTKQDEVVKQHSLDERATRLVPTLDGSGLLVSHEESGNLEFLEIPTLRRRGQVQVGKSPSGVVASGDGRLAYVAGWSSGTIAMVDLRSVRLLRTVEIGGGPDGLACLHSGTL